MWRNVLPTINSFWLVRTSIPKNFMDGFLFLGKIKNRIRFIPNYGIPFRSKLYADRFPNIEKLVTQKIKNTPGPLLLEQRDSSVCNWSQVALPLRSVPTLALSSLWERSPPNTPPPIMLLSFCCLLEQLSISPACWSPSPDLVIKWWGPPVDLSLGDALISCMHHSFSRYF